MTAREDIWNALSSRFENKRTRRIATVISVPLDKTGHTKGHVTALINSQRVRIDNVPPGATYFPGDTLIVEEMGSKASAYYQPVGTTASTRPNSGMFIFPESATVNGDDYEAGDVLFGGTLGDSPNWLYKYATGIMYRRVGKKVIGAWYPSGDEDVGPPDGMHEHYDSVNSSRQTMNGETILAEFAGDTLSIIGWQRWGNPLGPCIEAGTINDVDEEGNPVLGDDGNQQTRYVLRMLGENGVPIFSVMTGTETDPNDASMFIGAIDASNRLTWTGNTLTLTGVVSATSGSIGGWTIGADSLSGTDVLLESSGHITIGDGANSVQMSSTDATYRLWIGAADPVNAPFKVTRTGTVYASDVYSLIAKNTGTTSIGIDAAGTYCGVSGSSSGDIGVRGTGTAGVYGVGSHVGVEGLGDEIGVYANGGLYSIQIAGGPFNANNQSIIGASCITSACVNITGDEGGYLYNSGSDIYWKGGSSAAIKLN